MRDSKGRFLPGHRQSPRTELTKGKHWRNPQPYWGKAWLEQEYLVRERSAAEIGAEQGCTENNILFWLSKHEIPRRGMAEIRQIKKWGLSGESNGMFGKCGPLNPNWKGGISAERQAFYASQEWAGAVSFIWKRDKARCQRCHRKAKRKSFHIHHRVTFGVKEIRSNLDNLVLLCPKCHRWVHSKRNTQKEYIGAFQISFERG